MENSIPEPIAKMQIQLCKIFKNVPSMLVAEVMRMHANDTTSTLELLTAVSRLDAALLSSVLTMSGGNMTTAVSLLKAMCQPAKSSMQAVSRFQLYNDLGETPSECGYCHSKKKARFTYGTNSDLLTVQDYQDLVDRGWRRSGSYLYRPFNDKSCCSQYTIRLDALRFSLSRHKRHIWNLFQRYLNGENWQLRKASLTNLSPVAVLAASTAMSVSSSDTVHGQCVKAVPTWIVDMFLVALNAMILEPDLSGNTSTTSSLDLCSAIAELLLLLNTTRVKSLSTASVTAKTNKHRPPHLVRARHLGCANEMFSSPIALYLAAKLAPPKLRHFAVSPDNNVSSPSGVVEAIPPTGVYTAFQIGTQIAAYLNRHPSIAKIEVASNGYVNIDLVPIEPIAKSTAVNKIHSKTRTRVPMELSLKKRILTVSLEPAICTDEAFELYKKYQIHVHHDAADKLTLKQYTHFLCDSPLTGDNPYGAFHQHYRIDGKLFAVGVIDILPYCVSSVYFFYDPALEFLSPGVVSALMEIAFVKELSTKHPKLHYYYMGYYIHTCPKMRYKAQYQPADLLCPERHTWHPLSTECLIQLSRTPYVVFSDTLPRTLDETASSSTTSSTKTVATLPPKLQLAADGTRWLNAMRFKSSASLHAQSFVKLSASMQKALRNSATMFAALVGPVVAERCIVEL